MVFSFLHSYFILRRIQRFDHSIIDHHRRAKHNIYKATNEFALLYGIPFYLSRITKTDAQKNGKFILSLIFIINLGELSIKLGPYSLTLCTKVDSIN